MHFLRNKITPCFSTQSLRGGSSTPAELHLLGAQDDAFDRKYWHEGWKSLAQFNFPKRSIEANVCSTQKRRSQAKFFGSNAGNSLLIFDVDLMNEDLQVLKHLSVCKEANFYILLRSHFSRSRPSTYSISAIMFQRFFLFAINAYKNSFRQPFHVLYYAREESPAPIACLATILSHLLQLSHSTLCVANILI